MKKQVFASIVIVLLSAAALLSTLALFKNRSHGEQIFVPMKLMGTSSAGGAEKEKGLFSLARKYEDVIGWISFEDETNGVVVVQGEDSEAYTKTDVYGNASSYGAVRLDSRIEIEGNASNYLLYGDAEAPGGLGFVRSYLDLSFLKEHPLLRFETLRFEPRLYRIIAVFYGTEDSFGDRTPLLPLRFEADEDETEDENALASFIAEIKMRSLFDIPVNIFSGDRFLTLAAQHDEWDGAWIGIAAREIRADETSDLDPEEIVRNASAIYPDGWYEAHGSAPTVDAKEEFERRLNWFIEQHEKRENPEPTEDPAEEEDEGDGEGTGMSGPSALLPLPTVLPATPTPPPAAATPKPTATATAPVPPETPTATPTPPPVETPTSTPEPTVPVGQTIRVQSYSTGKIFEDSPVGIVSMIVEAEVGSSFSAEAIKAQAVAVITYLQYSYERGQLPIVPLLSASQKVKDAVSEVIGTAMFYGGNYIYAPYCSSMAGRSNACGEVWVQDLPYLVSVESKYDATLSSYNRTYSYTKAEMKETLEAYYEISLSDNPAQWIQVLGYTSGGYVAEMSIDGQYTTTGSRFRANCMHIRSAAFTHLYDPVTELFTIVTSGYGHGVGMSQYGANLYAVNEGWDHRQILSHYYTGISFGSSGW